MRPVASKENGSQRSDLQWTRSTKNKETTINETIYTKGGQSKITVQKKVMFTECAQ